MASTFWACCSHDCIDSCALCKTPRRYATSKRDFPFVSKYLKAKKRYMFSKSSFLDSDGGPSAQGDDAGLVDRSVGVTEQNVWEASLQRVLAQEGRLLHYL